MFEYSIINPFEVHQENIMRVLCICDIFFEMWSEISWSVFAINIYVQSNKYVSFTPDLVLPFMLMRT